MEAGTVTIPKKVCGQIKRITASISTIDIAGTNEIATSLTLRFQIKL